MLSVRLGYDNPIHKGLLHGALTFLSLSILSATGGSCSINQETTHQLLF